MGEVNSGHLEQEKGWRTTGVRETRSGPLDEVVRLELSRRPAAVLSDQVARLALR
jgi:hypothetical protein